MARVRAFSLAVLIVFAFLVVNQASAQAQDKQTSKGDAKASTTAPASQAAGAAGYAGAEACKTCHEDIYNGWEKSPHWKTTLYTRVGHEKQGCEACHGAGAAHIQNPGDPATIFHFKTASTKETSARCMECHESGKEQMNFEHSVHAQNNVGCLDCHSPHHAKVERFLLVNRQPGLCYNCHLQTKPQFNMPFHHRVNEGLVGCSDCHNPHGSFQPKQLRASASQDAVCFKCHVDKQGPFVFEHDPVKTEGCESCHSPHGSSNPHLLRLSNVNLLCLQCHTQSSLSGTPGTPSFHDQSTQFQACTMCHNQIHGSNFDSRFFK